MPVSAFSARMLKVLLIVTFTMAGFHGFPLPDAVKAEGEDEFDALRSKWSFMLTGGIEYDPSDPDIAKRLADIRNAVTNIGGTGYWDTMNKAADRTSLWSDLASTTISAHIQSSYSRTQAMALAYATKGSALQGDPSLRDDIVGALEWLYANRYNENKKAYDNWYDWELGSPLLLNDIMALMYKDLTAEQIAKYIRAIDTFSPSINPGDTGANRVWRSTVIAVNGVISKNAAKITAGRDGLSEVFLYVTAGDGFYEDGSFIQHNKHPYTGGYGKVLLESMSEILYLLERSSWDVTDPNKRNVYRWVYDSFEPVIYDGALMDMVRGREISRRSTQDHSAGRTVISAILRLSQSAPPADKAAFQSMVKYWITADTYRSFTAFSSIEMIVRAKAVLNDPAVVSRGERIAHKPFPSMDRVVHLRPGFGFGLSLSSSRTYKYESINKENLKGWYTSDGMTYLYNGDQGHYSDDYWATVNPYRLPGITVDTQPRLAEDIPWGTDFSSPKAWVGGTSMDGLYGAAGMDLGAYNSLLTAKKSWFMFDDEIVAVGAGITSAENRTIETIVDNRKINGAGNNALTVNGSAKSSAIGWSETMSGTRWAHLAGHTSNADIGYYFPGGAEIKGLREARTGKWSDINQNPTSANSTPVTRNYVNLWFDHGVNPADASYSYVLLPNKDAAQTSAYASSPDVEIVKNTKDVQAVREKKLGLLGANFWSKGLAEYIRSYQPASVMVKEGESELTVSVSDPTQTQEKLTLELSKVGLSVIRQDPTVTVLSLAPNIKLQINTSGSKGRTHSIKLSYDPNAEQSKPLITKLAPLADSYVESANPSMNYGSSAVMGVTSSTGNTRQAYMKFDTSTVTGEIESASLNVYAAVTDSKGGSKENKIYEVLYDGWAESGTGGINWSNKPATGNVLASVYAEPAFQWLKSDVASYVAAEHAGDKVAGFALLQQGSGLYTTVYSKENANAALRPYLEVRAYRFIGPQLDDATATAGVPILKIGESTQIQVEGFMEDGAKANLENATIVYTSDNPAAVSVDLHGLATAHHSGNAGITATVTMNGVTRTASLSLVAAVNGLEQAAVAASADSYVESGNRSKNYGSAASLAVTSSSTNTRQSYFKYDLSAVTGEVYSAKLMIYAKNTDSKGGIKENKLYGVEDDRWTENEIVWNNKPPAGKHLSTVEIDTTWQWREYDVTAFVKEQYGGDKTASFALLQEGPGLYITINSKENANNKPYLRIETYSIEPS